VRSAKLLQIKAKTMPRGPIQTIRRAIAPSGELGQVINDMIAENGTGLDKIRSILSLRMAQYNSIELTEEETRNIAKSFIDIELGSATNMVMICNKLKCLYKNRCAFYKADKAPEGRECIVENKVMSHAVDQYITSLGVNINNYPEMVLVNQLTEYELIEFRCNTILSYDHVNLKMKSVIGIDVDGNVITKEDISHALQIKMQVFKNKIQLLEAFTATRKEAYKKQAALKESKDGHAKVLSAMKTQLKELKNKSASSEEVIEELNIIGEDVTIEEYR
jgi:hypothetical protein